MTAKVQKVDMVVCPLPTPSDTSAIEAAIQQGRVKMAALVAVVGKVIGTGLQNDYGRELADRQIRELIGRDQPFRLSIRRAALARFLNRHASLVVANSRASATIPGRRRRRWT